MSTIRKAWWLPPVAWLVLTGCLCGDPPPSPPTAKRVVPAPGPEGGATSTEAGAEPLAPPQVGPRIELSGDNNQLSFALSGKLWGVAWRRQTGRRTRLHIGDTCYEEVYFTVFDDDLELVLNQPLRAMKRRKCVPTMKVELVATPNGFAVSPSDVGALFDLSSKSFQEGSSFPPKIPLAPELESPPEGEAAYGTEVHEVTAGAGSVIRAWLVPDRKAMKGDLQLRYLYSPDGKKETKRGTVLSVSFDDQHWTATRLVRTGATVSLFVVVRHKMFRQQFDSDGERLGELELLFEELDSEPTMHPQDGKSIHNLNVGVLGADCVILYTRGNGGMKVFSCKTNEKRYLGEAGHPKMLCTGGRCVISESGGVIRFLEP